MAAVLQSTVAVVLELAVHLESGAEVAASYTATVVTDAALQGAHTHRNHSLQN